MRPYLPVWFLIKESFKPGSYVRLGSSNLPVLYLTIINLV